MVWLLSSLGGGGCCHSDPPPHSRLVAVLVCMKHKTTSEWHRRWMRVYVYSLAPLCIQAPGDRVGYCIYLSSYLGSPMTCWFEMFISQSMYQLPLCLPLPLPFLHPVSWCKSSSSCDDDVKGDAKDVLPIWGCESGTKPSQWKGNPTLSLNRASAVWRVCSHIRGAWPVMT